MPFRHVSRSTRRLSASAIVTVSALALLVPLAPGPDGVPSVDDPDTPITAAAHVRAAEDAPTDSPARRGKANPPAPYTVPVGLRAFVQDSFVVTAADEIEPAPEPEPEPAPEPEPEASSEPEPDHEHPETEEESDCPENSSPDCTYTYTYDISTWEALAECESGGDWTIDSGNGYYGGVQFSVESWESVGGSGYPNEHSMWTQIHYAERLQANQGWDAWPACSQKLGLS